MNVLIIGEGKGSWIMRGQQLGAAIGARVTSCPGDADWTWAAVVVLVKRAGRKWAETARRFGVPIVWDALDFWRQPADNAATEVMARQMLAHELTVIQPALTIGATEAMAAAAGGAYLPHHGRIGLNPTPAREHAQVVGYDGNPVYLGRWAKALEANCRARGWTFVVNPPDLAAVDILVALRDDPFDGWMCREWKSGVKLGNAVLAGRPIITQDGAAFREMQPMGHALETPEQLAASLDWWRPVARRQGVVEDAMDRSLDLVGIGQKYLQLLASVARVEVPS